LLTGLQAPERWLDVSGQKAIARRPDDRAPADCKKLKNRSVDAITAAPVYRCISVRQEKLKQRIDVVQGA